MSQTPISYFEQMYERDPDPWGFETRWYETRKYALTLAALPRARYRRAFEPGCSHGVLTDLLADRVESLVASEIVPSVAERARARLQGKPHVEILGIKAPEEWPEGTFDLMVLSEVAYYLGDPGLTYLLARADASLETRGHVVAVHWTGATNYPLSGAAVHERLAAHPGWTSLVHHREREFVLDVYEREGAK